MAPLSRAPDIVDCEPLGGARVVRDSKGAIAGGRAIPTRVAEEIYVTPNGSGRIIVDERSMHLAPLVTARIAPTPARELKAGPHGLEVLAFGSHSPGDGEMVAAS
ncbi:MAG TPA: hypothetical protein VHB30_03780 [Solirubrobacteraceae bacterium]|jgi:hypothetical protein|nr:hypothetical protein [Solirubrobacteraceae bacterium]